MHSYYIISFDYFLFYRLGTRELRVMWGGWEGSYDLPPSCGWPCLVESKLFLKPRKSHPSLYVHHRKFQTEYWHVFMIQEGFQTQINRWLTHLLYIWSNLILVSFEVYQIVMHGTPSIIPIVVVTLFIFITSYVIQNKHHAN